MMLSVVMPAYNEEAVIAATVRALAAELDRQGFAYEILVVNDKSRDGTAEVLRALEDEFPHLRHVDNPGPHGYGCAVRCGLAHFRGDAVVVQRVLNAAESVKCDLSLLQHAEVRLPFVAQRRGNPVDMVLHVGRQTLNSLCEDLVDRTLRYVDEVLLEAKLEAADIDEVLLVGGQTRMPLLQARLERRARDFLQQEVRDPDTRRKLTPDYAAGCKRRCISDDYLAAFNRPNVHLVTETIAEIEAHGIRDASGTLHEVDTIIEATGFRPFDIHEYVDIRGRDGIRLQDQWRDRVESYRTVMAPGFPNFFMLLGPNSATGHTSALIMIEAQARFVIRCLRLLGERNARHVEPTMEATRRFNFRIQRDMQQMVFSGGCHSWYTDEHDHNYTLWPYSALRFCAEFLRLKPDELKIER
jgi:hypothetical protein